MPRGTAATPIGISPFLVVRPKLILPALGADLTVMLVDHRDRCAGISGYVVNIHAASDHLRDVIVTQGIGGAGDFAKVLLQPTDL